MQVLVDLVLFRSTPPWRRRLPMNIR